MPNPFFLFPQPLSLPSPGQGFRKPTRCNGWAWPRFWKTTRPTDKVRGPSVASRHTSARPTGNGYRGPGSIFSLPPLTREYGRLGHDAGDWARKGMKKMSRREALDGTLPVGPAN